MERPGLEPEWRDVSARKLRMRCAMFGDGPPLLLLHGLLMDHGAWDDVIPGLARHYRVIAPDLPGFGESEKPPPTRFDYGVEAFMECVADLISALGIGRTHVIGHGLGGAIALTLAAQNAEFVDKLVLVDAHVFGQGQRAASRTFSWPVLGSFFFKQLYGRRLFRGYFRDRIFSPGFPLPVAQVDRFYDMFNTPAARESALATLTALEDTRSTVARLGRVKAPTFVVWGAGDSFQPPQVGQRLAREVNAARFSVMDSGAAPHMEQSKAFVESVLSFFLEKNRDKKRA